MFSRKATLIVLAGAVLAGAVYAGKLYLASRKQEPQVPVFSGYEPRIPDGPPLLAMDEKSGELTRVINRNPKTGKIDNIVVGYKDGRSGVYVFKNGKLRAYKSFDESKQLKYEASYEPNGLVSDYRFVRPDGSTETQFRRLPDGSEEHLFLNKDGFVIKSVVTARDGSRTVSNRADLSKPAVVEQTKAEPSEKTFGPIRKEDGSPGWRLKVKATGVRVNSWEYFSSNGQLMHSGMFADNGNIEITLFTSDGKPGLKQVWRCVGEDWSGRIYNLASIQRLDSDGKISLEIVLYPDGRTPMEVHNHSWGYENSVEHFDKGGFHYRTEYFDSNGSPTTSYDLPANYRPQAKVPPQMLSPPTDEAKNPAYRLNGAPYANPLPENGYPLNPLFVLPD